MGAGSSKPTDTHVWKAPGPVGVSQDVVDSIQTNRESDVSRAQSLELAVQARVAEELRKLQDKENAALKAAQRKAAEISEKEEKDAQSQNSSKIVSKEVETLRSRLEKRKQVKELPESVERTRSELVSCLTENDRRPLNCWKEVEAFKDEVRRLEKGWVDKVTQ